MSGSPTIQVLAPHEWRVYRDIRLRALADSPDAFASTLAREQDRHDDEWMRRVEAGTDARYHLPLVARLGGEPVGLAWGRVMADDPDVAHLFQMWVAPEARRLGVGLLLVSAVVDWARRVGARQVELDVTCGNTPAQQLYLGAGFKEVGEARPMNAASGLLEQRMRLTL